MIGPHSKACGWREHPHGAQCHPNCPTCHGAVGFVDEAYDLTPAEFTGELLSVPALPTGVIVGVREEITIEWAETTVAMLEARFPGVRFAVIGGCSAIASFTYDPETTT